MRYELLHKYKKEIEDGILDKIILDKHVLEFNSCMYYKLFKDGTLMQITEESSEEEKQWIKERDLLSNYINSNKSITKSVLSNNIYAVFFNVEKLKKGNKAQLTPETLEKDYFDKIIEREENLYLLKCNEKNSINKKDIPFLKDMDYMDLDDCNFIKNRFITAFKEISKEYKDQIAAPKQKGKKKDKTKYEKAKKIKIFYDETIENYKRESDKDTRLKVFAKNDLCFSIDGVLYGPPYVDINTNNNKTFLINNATPYEIGFNLSFEEVLNLRKIDLFLQTFKSKDEKGNYHVTKDIYLSNNLDINLDDDIIGKISTNSQNYLYISQEKQKTGYTIEDFNVISGFDLEKNKMKIINYMGITRDGLLMSDEELPFNVVKNKLYDILNPLKIKPDLLESKKLNINYKNIQNFLKDGDTRYVLSTYEKFFKMLLFDIYKDTDLPINYLTKKVLNYKLSFENHIKGELRMNVNNFKMNILEKINSNVDLESDNEFLFLYGQVYYYLTSLSKSSNKKLDFINLPARANSIKSLKIDLKRLIEKYDYDISFYHSKFITAVNLLFRYELKEKLTMLTNDYLYIGLTYNNMFYDKNENKIDNDNE